MSKITQIGIFMILLIASGVVYVKYYRPQEIAPIQETGIIHNIQMRSVKSEWRFDPAEVHAKAGDRVRIHIFNEDNYDHGFALEAFGVNRRLFPGQETLIEFTASKPGKHQFYCSVPCGEGHYKQQGTVIVDP